MEPTRVVWGWLRGEAFYQGRPTSWWRTEVDRWNIKLAYSTGGYYSYGRENSRFEQVLSNWLKLPERHFPDLLNGDPEAIPVLRTLQNDSSTVVRDWARIGLERSTNSLESPFGFGWITKGLRMNFK